MSLPDASTVLDGLWAQEGEIEDLIGSPDASLASIGSAIDAYAAALAAANFGPRPSMRLRALLAESAGQVERAEYWLEQWMSTPTDEASDCEACELDDGAALLARRDPAAALAMLEPVVTGAVTCDEAPGVALSWQALLAARAGEDDLALTSHRAGWPLVRDRVESADAVARHLRALVGLGHLERAVSHLIPRLPWLDGDLTGQTRLDLAAAGALALRAARAAGLDLDAIGDVAAGELAALLTQTAYGLAEAFDQRNGNPVATELLDDVLGGPGDSPLPASVRAAAPGLAPLRLGVVRHVVAPETAYRTVAALAAEGQRRLDAVDPSVERIVATWLGRRDALLASALRGDWAGISFLDRTAAAGVPPESSHRLLGSARRAALNADDEVLVDRADAALLVLQGETSDSPEERAAIEGRVGAIVDDLVSLGAADQGALVLASMATRGVVMDPAATLRDALDLAGTDRPLLRARLSILLASALGPEAPESMAVLDAASALSGVPDHPWLPSEIAALRGRAARSRGNLMDAGRLLTESVEAKGLDDPSIAGRLLDLCEVLGSLTHWAGVERYATRLAQVAARLHEPMLLALAHRFLGMAALESADPWTAVESLEVALPILREQGSPLVGPTAFALASAYVLAEDFAAARTAYAVAAGEFERAGRRDAAAEAHYRAGDAAWHADDAPAADGHFATAVDHARAAGHLDLFINAARDRAGVHAASGDLAAGLAELDAVPDEVAALARMRGMSPAAVDLAAVRCDVLLHGAEILAALGEEQRAITRARQALDVAPDEVHRLAAQADLARFHAASGDFDEASRLAEEIGTHRRSPEIDGIRDSMYHSLADAFAAASRFDEADAWLARLSEPRP